MVLSSCVAAKTTFSSADQTERLKKTFSTRKEISQWLDGVSLPKTESRERLSCVWIKRVYDFTHATVNRTKI